MINSRQYPNGDHQKSHWQTVLPITSARPIPIVNGEAGTTSTTTISIEVESTIDVKNIQIPPTYKLDGTVDVVTTITPTA